METDLTNRERDNQRQWEDSKIRQARYNTRYREIKIDGRGSRYLSKDGDYLNRGEEVRALINLRYGNLEKANKY